MIPTKSVYFIKNNELYYVNDLKDHGKRSEFHRGPIPSELMALFKRKTFRFNDGRSRKGVWIFEYEMTSINEWVMKWNEEFILNPPYAGKQIIRLYGKIPNYDDYPELEGMSGYCKSQEFIDQNKNTL